MEVESTFFSIDLFAILFLVALVTAVLLCVKGMGWNPVMEFEVMPYLKAMWRSGSTKARGLVDKTWNAGDKFSALKDLVKWNKAKSEDEEAMPMKDMMHEEVKVDFDHETANDTSYGSIE